MIYLTADFHLSWLSESEKTTIKSFEEIPGALATELLDEICEGITHYRIIPITDLEKGSVLETILDVDIPRLEGSPCLYPGDTLYVMILRAPEDPALKLGELGFRLFKITF